MAAQDEKAEGAVTPGARLNNFNLLRMIGATAVLVSHAFPIAYGGRALEPLQSATGVKLGTLAVLGFFAISGYFISQSFDNSLNLTRFVAARVLRIFPALFVVLLLTAFVLGPFVTAFPLARYAASAGTWTYVPKNLSLHFLQYELPGVFTTNPYPSAINGSLWTLFFEVSCYAGVAIVGSVGLLKRGWLSFALFFVFAALLVPAPGHSNVLNHLCELGFPFLLGVLFYVARRTLSMSVLWFGGLSAALIVLVWSGQWRHWATPTASIGIALLVFSTGFVQFRPLLIYNRLGDYSYGMYIYAFPVEQVVEYISRNSSALQVMALSFPITLALAIVSWHFIEGPALRLKKHRMSSPPLPGGVARRLSRLPFPSRAAP